MAARRGIELLFQLSPVRINKSYFIDLFHIIKICTNLLRPLRSRNIVGTNLGTKLSDEQTDS